MKNAKKFFSMLLCAVLLLSAVPLMAPKAKAYTWSSHWRYKTSENGSWQYPQYDPLNDYNGTGFWWVDFYGSELPDAYNMGEWHPNCSIKNGSTLVLTNSGSIGWCYFCNWGSSNLFRVEGGGTLIVGERVCLLKENSYSAVAMEGSNGGQVYIANQISTNYNSAQVWTDRTTTYHRLGVANSYSGSNLTVKDYYKLTLNKGSNISSVTYPSDYLFKGRAFEPYLAQGAHFYAAGTNYTINCTPATGYHFTNWTGAATYSSQNATINLSGYSAKTLTANAAPNTYTVTLNANGGSGGSASVTATYNAAMPSATMPSRTGYTFQGYYDTSVETGGTQYYTATGASARTWNKTSATTLYARWAPNTNTAYTVEHYYMNTSGSYDAEASATENKTGTTAATVTHTDVKADRTGFTYDAALSGTSSVIAADGSTVVRLYYSRNQHTVTFVDAYTGQTLKTQTGVYYGTGATAPTPAAYHEIEGDGANHMKFTGWDQAFDDITDDLTVNALYEEEAHDVWSGYTNNGDDHSRTCESCGYVETGSHVWAWTVDDDPTCGAAGKQHQECENCDAVQSENTVIEPTGEHVWKWVVDTDPTCGAAGKQHQECENCDAVQSENTAIEPTGEHVWKWVVDTDPTCGTAGKKHQECENCDAVQNENTAIDPTGEHDFEWIVDSEPDCNDPGVKHEKCKNCDATQSANTEIPATGHTFGAWTVTKPATCEEDGTESRICAACGKQDDRVIRSTGSEHKWGAWVETKAPTCAQAGEQTRTCAICGKTETRSVEKLSHQWGEWINDAGSEATCTSGGTQHRECAVCGEIETRDIPGGFGHHVANPNLRGEGYCEYCGEFVCNRCEDMTQYEDLDIIGIFFRIVHFFIHFAHMISYHS